MNKFFSDPDVVVFRYTRAQALEDGVLVDVSGWASTHAMMGGFTIPVAVTSAVWALLQPPEGSHESIRGRAHDVLWMASLAARRHINSDRATFTVQIGNSNIRMWLHVGPGDDAEPVATIMLEGED